MYVPCKYPAKLQLKHRNLQQQLLKLGQHVGPLVNQGRPYSVAGTTRFKARF